MEKKSKVLRRCGIVVNSIVIFVSIAIIVFGVYIGMIHESGLYGYATDNFLEDVEAFTKNPYSGEMLHDRGIENPEMLYKIYNEEKQRYLALYGENAIPFEKYVYINYYYNFLYDNYDTGLIPDVSEEELNAKYEAKKVEIINENNGDEESFSRFIYGVSLYTHYYQYMAWYLETVFFTCIFELAFLIILAIIELVYFIKDVSISENLKIKIFLLIMNIVEILSILLMYFNDIFSCVLISAIIIIFLTLFYLFYKTKPGKN